MADVAETVISDDILRLARRYGACKVGIQRCHGKRWGEISDSCAKWAAINIPELPDDIREYLYRRTGCLAWFRNGKRHRDDGPAVVYPGGSKIWYRDGKRHREDGPAVVLADGTKEWWCEGVRRQTMKVCKKQFRVLRTEATEIVSPVFGEVVHGDGKDTTIIDTTDVLCSRCGELVSLTIHIEGSHAVVMATCECEEGPPKDFWDRYSMAKHRVRYCETLAFVPVGRIMGACDSEGACDD